jgi:osmotically-inducible protein OsmY
MAVSSRDLGGGVMNLLAPARADHEAATSTPRTAIVREAEKRLRQSSYLALRDVCCLASDGVVVLHGRLPSFYLKQIAQEIVCSLDGVRQVVNRIEVFEPWRRDRDERPRVTSPIESRRAVAAPRGRGCARPEHATKERNSQQCWS